MIKTKSAVTNELNMLALEGFFFCGMHSNNFPACRDTDVIAIFSSFIQLCLES